MASQKDPPRNTTKFFRGQAQLISEHWSWNPTNSLQSTFRSNLSELRNPFSVDYYLAYLSTTNFYDQAMLESRNVYDIGLLQNARTHGPRGTVKTTEKPILHRTQVHYFCSGNSNEDAYIILDDLGYPHFRKPKTPLRGALVCHCLPLQPESHSWVFFRGFGIGHSGTKHPSCIKLPSAFLGTSRSG